MTSTRISPVSVAGPGLFYKPSSICGEIQWKITVDLKGDCVTLVKKCLWRIIFNYRDKITAFSGGGKWKWCCLPNLFGGKLHFLQMQLHFPPYPSCQHSVLFNSFTDKKSLRQKQKESFQI